VQFLVTVAVLVTAPPSGGAGARLGEAKASLVAAERARGVDVVEDAAELVAAGWTAEKNLAFFGRAAELVSDGRRALARVELEKAETLLAQAESAYAPELARPGVAEEWADAAKWHGVALFELKRRDEAVAAWGRAKALHPDALLTEAMVRPEVARAFAAARAGERPAAPSLAEASLPASERLGLDAVIEAAIAIDAGVLTFAARRRGRDCATDVVTATRADALARRLDEAPCRAGAPAIAVAEAPVIAHPRAAPSLAKTAPERRARVWQKPWLWVGVVGALGVGVVLAASLWPRDASYSAVADFHSFALGGR